MKIDVWVVWDNKNSKIPDFLADKLCPYDHYQLLESEEMGYYAEGIFFKKKKDCQGMCDIFNAPMIICYNQPDLDDVYKIGHDEDGFDVSKYYIPRKATLELNQ